MANFATLTPDQVQQKVSDRSVKLVDVRTIDENEQERIPGSILLPLHELDELYSSVLEKDDEIIVYCQHGVRSQQASEFLVSQGYTNVSHMLGGIASWNGPTESE